MKTHGFSLLEILVALVLIGLLVGALVPTVLNQVTRGEVNRVVEDLKTVENSAKGFRVDVTRWPGDLDDLTTTISTTDSDINATFYPNGLVGKWNGPYIEGVVVADGGTLETAAGGLIDDNFVKKTLNSQEYLAVSVTGLTDAMIKDVSDALEGDTLISDDDAGGRLRAVSSTLYYLAAPIK